MKKTISLSSGNLFLDKIIGEFQLGSLVLLVEDSPTDIYKTFLKYFIAEGVVNEQKIFFYYNDEKLRSQVCQALPYKSSQVEAILNAKKVQSDSEMKIAWRYENIQYSNLLEDLAKNSKYIFDLSRNLQDSYFLDKNRDILQEKMIARDTIIDTLDDFIFNLTRDYQKYAEGEDPKYARIVFPSIFSDLSGDVHLPELMKRLLALRNLTRSLNAVVYITINREMLKEEVFNLFAYFSDYLLSLKSFLTEISKLQEYDALFKVEKLPQICVLKSVFMETDTYGVLVEKRKVVIEKIDIGVEIDRNTKVKETDLASVAMCGKENYTKHYEF